MLDADLAFLLARYGRVSAAEMAVLTLVWQATEGRGREWARISTASPTEDAPAVGDYLGIHARAAGVLLRSLYADGRMVRGKLSHHLLRRQPGHIRHSYAINLDWRTWGWVGAVDFDRLDRDRRRIVGTLPTGSWSITAEALAGDFAERLRSGGAHAPPLDLGDMTFRRWCRTVQRLLAEADADTVHGVLVFAATDPYWSHRVAGYDADRNVAALFHHLTRTAPPRRAAA